MRGCALLFALVAAGCARERGFAKCTPPATGFDLNTALDRYPTLAQVCVVDTDETGKLIFQKDSTLYDLGSTLFSDYALKFRTIWMPAGQKANWVASDVLDFPNGTIITKTFAFPKDYRMADRDVRIVETRLLVKGAGGWVALPYVWNDRATEALLTVEGASRPQTWTDEAGQPGAAGYLVPAQTQCALCHESNKVLHPIGPKARWLNHGVQAQQWIDGGRLNGAPPADQWEKQPKWDDPMSGTVAERARAYLEINCGHCHSQDGLARTTGLSLMANTADPMQLGVCKRPVAAGEASNGLSYDIVPGKPDESILVFRMESTKPSIMMPEIGRTVQHKEAVQLIRQWVMEMPGGCP
jgi:uncharacterized repeat protein (TIGR03806 family)